MVTNLDGTTVTARGGLVGSDYNGGSGWSGGGSYGGVGGNNGGNGQDSSGSKFSGGSGQHTALPTIPGVSILPGAGGKPCIFVSNQLGSACYGGGGGGGILINGEGTRDHDSGAHGYGAGGGPFNDRWSRGQSGAVILYV